MSAHHACLRESLTGIRTALSMLIYTPENTEWLSRVDMNHHAGGVMDHLQELINSLTPEPGDREPFFPPSMTRATAVHDMTTSLESRDPVQGSVLTSAQVADGWHYCPAFDDLLTQGENHTGDHCLCGHPNRVF
jgi:hypothetical protein